MNVFRNDKVILIKEIDNLKMVGETFEVANVTDNAVILRNATNKIAVGAIDIDVFDKYFKKPELAKGWTSWENIVDENSHLIAFYRTNQKKVQVKMPGGFRSESTCNKCDEFNLYLGITIAMDRCLIKALKHEKKKYEKDLKAVENNISALESHMERTIKSISNRNFSIN